MTDYARKAFDLLKDKELKISAAESCTGGMLTKKITDIPGSAAVLDLSVVTYANAAKVKMLGVSDKSIEKYGVVSETVAVQMAEGVAALMDAEVGVGITGIAGPGGGSEEKPVGLVWTAVRYKGKTYPARLQLSGDRDDIRNATCDAVFKNIIDIIENN